jgi:hypothetical protein
VYFEHLIYSAALAVIVGMIFSRYYGRDPSWIIIAVAFVPDIDVVLQGIQRLTRRVFTVIIQHGDLHNILLLIGLSLLFATVLHRFGIMFTDGLICSAVGIAAHFLEDALVYNPAYAFLWPITTQTFGIGILEETRNFFGIASSTVLLIGIILLAGAVLVRTLIEGRGWWQVFLNGGRIDAQSS